MEKQIGIFYNNKQEKILKIKSFFFPLFPLKAFSSINCIAILAILISLRMVLQLTSIYIPVFSFSISVAWIPLIMIGWIYGPVYGVIAGFITDSLGTLISSSTWFWMYAIQEPIVGLLGGCFSYLCTFRNYKNSKNKNVVKPFFKQNWFDFTFFQILLIGFSAVCVYALLTQTINNLSFESKSKLESYFFTYSKWIILGSVLFFLLLMESISCFFWKKNSKNFIFCLWIICVVCFISMSMSFLLGPISANAYYKYLYGVDSPYFVKYGVIFYLIPRTFKESIKAPIEIAILLVAIPIANYYLNEIKMQKFLKWNSKKYK